MRSGLDLTVQHSSSERAQLYESSPLWREAI